MAEWTKAAGCKPVSIYSRWFESNLKHITNKNRASKLFFSYILSPQLYTFFSTKVRGGSSINVLVNEKLLYFLIMHLKLSTNFYSSQLSDIFAYETYSKLSVLGMSSTVVVFNFHNLIFQERFFIFSAKNSFLKSITELYPNASWLEREVAELHGFNFVGKKDVRNLMLQYGDTSAPFRKSFPSIGRKEMFYDGVNDLIVQSPVSFQI